MTKEKNCMSKLPEQNIKEIVIENHSLKRDRRIKFNCRVLKQKVRILLSSLGETTREHQESIRDLKNVKQIKAMCQEGKNKDNCMQYTIENLDKMNPWTKTELIKISFFFSKMHILWNIVGEVDKCLMMFEN